MVEMDKIEIKTFQDLIEKKIFFGLNKEENEKLELLRPKFEEFLKQKKERK